MGYKRAERYIRTEKKRVQNLDELVDISHGMWDNNFGPDSDGIPHSVAEEELGLDLGEDTRRSFEHLVDIDILEKIENPSGPNRYTIAEWRDGNDAIVNGAVPEAAQEGIENLIDHIHEEDPPGSDDAPAVADGSGTTVRSVVASEFNVAPEAVETTLQNGDPVERLNDAVEAIEESDAVDTTENYGKITWVNSKKHYRQSKWAIELYESEDVM